MLKYVQTLPNKYNLYGPREVIFDQNPSLTSGKSYLPIIIIHNSNEKMTKSKIKSSWSRLKHCSKPLA